MHVDQVSEDPFEDKTVRHRSRPEWGLGYVERRTAKSLWIVFENYGAGPLEFGHRVVESLLEIVPDENVPEDSPLRSPETRAALIRTREKEERAEQKLTKARSKQRSRSVPQGPIGVFTRNTRSLLAEAFEFSQENPESEVVFRSGRVWSTPHRWLKRGASPDIFLAVAEKKEEVVYRAKLSRVALKPKESEGMLDLVVPSTRDKELWGEEVKALYAVKALEKIEEPFSMTELVKVSDDKPINANYTRSYCLVRGRASDLPVKEEAKVESAES